jgi:rhodanese-related sulfurtransferase
MQQISHSGLLDLIYCKIHFQLIDVRSQEEHEQYNVGGINIPLEDLIRRSDEIPLNIPVIFYCRKGVRSQLAIQRLLEKMPEGDFYNLIGGIDNKK